MTTTTYNTPVVGSSSTWGKIQSVKPIAEGIDWITTASHGGFVVSPARLEQMPENLRKCSFTQDNNFEEDCSWCAVVIAFPNHFPVNILQNARECYEACYRAKHGW